MVDVPEVCLIHHSLTGQQKPLDHEGSRVKVASYMKTRTVYKYMYMYAMVKGVRERRDRGMVHVGGQREEGDRGGVKNGRGTEGGRRQR